MRINVRIERVVLDGFSYDRGSLPLIEQAVQAELRKLFAEGNAASQLASVGHIASLQLKPIQLGPNANPECLGQEVATTLHGGLKG